MDFAVMRVGLGQPLLIPQQAAEAVVRAQFELCVHLDGFKRTDFDADLTTHADGNINVENSWIKLQLTHSVRFLVLAFFDIDALRRTLFFADLAADTTHASLPIVAVIDKERKISRRLDLR